MSSLTLPAYTICTWRRRRHLSLGKVLSIGLHIALNDRMDGLLPGALLLPYRPKPVNMIDHKVGGFQQVVHIRWRFFHDSIGIKD